MSLRPAVAIAALVLSGAAFASPSRSVDYLYIEANEGGSSGGHAAIRFGNETYHFQHEHPGVLRLRRDGSEHFRYAYGVLDNRTMHVSRVAASEAAYAELRQRFNDRYLVERQLFEERDALRDDRLLLERLVARRHGDATGTIDLRGAGFFFPAAVDSQPSAAGLALLARVEQTYGPDAVRQRVAQLEDELARLTPLPVNAPAPEISDGYPHFAYPFSSRYRDLLTGLAALQALERALPLRADARWPSDAELELDAAELGTLAAFGDRLTDQLVRLLRSDRPDWGYAFLVGLARLAALRETRQTGRLVLLDAFPSRPEVLRWSVIEPYHEALADLLAEAGDEFARARMRLRSAASIEERDYAEVEAAGNRLLELDVAAREKRDLRVSETALPPSRTAAWGNLVVPDVDDAQLVRDLTQAKAVERLFATRLERRYAYDLFSRNCVSEIFETVGSAEAALGGRLAGRRWLTFIPFVSAGAVNGRWNVTQRMTLRSYRRSKLDEMYRHQSRLQAWLHEGNTLTSTIYRTNADDSFFLFFTDDLIVPRPVLGTVNVTVAIAAGALGVAMLPFDHGRTLAAGVRGVLFSLPELAFVNLRKGSFAYVRRADRPAEGPQDVAVGTP